MPLFLSENLKKIKETEYYTLKLGKKTYAVEKEPFAGGAQGLIYRAYEYTEEPEKLADDPIAIKINKYPTLLKAECAALNANQTHKEDQADFYQLSITGSQDTTGPWGVMTMRYIDACPAAIVQKSGDLEISNLVQTATFPERVRMWRDLILQLKPSYAHNDLKPDNVLTHSSSSLILYFPPELYPQNNKTTEVEIDGEKFTFPASTAGELSKSAYEHTLEKWKRQSKVGAVVFAFSPTTKQWTAHWIKSKTTKQKSVARLNGQIAEESYEEIDCDISEPIDTKSNFGKILYQINGKNSSSLDTTELNKLLETTGKDLFTDYKHDKNAFGPRTVKAKLIDYGVAQALTSKDGILRDNAPRGTAFFLPPEAYFDKFVGSKSDIPAAAGLFNFFMGASKFLSNKTTKNARDHITKNPDKYKNIDQDNQIKAAVTQQKFNKESFKDYEVLGTFNIKAVCIAFSDRMEEADYEKRVNLDDVTAFANALDAVCTINQDILNKVETKEIVNEEQPQKAAEPLYPHLAKLIMLSHVWQETAHYDFILNDIDKNIHSFAFFAQPKLCEAIVNAYINNDFNVAFTYDDEKNKLELTDYAKQTLQKFQDALLQEDQSENHTIEKTSIDVTGNGEETIHQVSKAEYNLLGKIELAHVNPVQALGEFQAGLLQTRRYTPPYQLFRSLETSKKILHFQEEMEYKAKHALNNIQGFIFNRTAASKWECSYLASEYIQLDDQTKNLKIHKDAKVILDLIAAAQTHDFGYTTALCNVQRKLESIIQEDDSPLTLIKKSASDRAFFETLKSQCIVNAEEINNVQLLDERKVHLRQFAQELNALITCQPALKDNVKFSAITDHLKNMDTSLDFAGLRAKIYEYLNHPRPLGQRISAFFGADPERELRKICMDNVKWLFNVDLTLTTNNSPKVRN